MIRFGFVAIITLLLTACGWGGKKDDRPLWVQSEETPALKVPEDLDPPRTDVALIVREEGIAALSEYDDENPLPPITDGLAGAPSAVKVGALGPYIRVEDSADSVWRRLGITLERSELSVLDTTKDSLSYQVNYVDDQPRRQKRGFFGRLAFWRGEKVETLSGDYQFRVVQEKDELSRIYLADNEGAPASEAIARRLLGYVDERLNN